METILVICAIVSTIALVSIAYDSMYLIYLKLKEKKPKEKYHYPLTIKLDGKEIGKLVSEELKKAQRTKGIY